MNILSITLLFISATFSALASVAIKYSDRIFLLKFFSGDIMSKIPALFFYGLGFIFYSIALKYSYISKAYPLMVSFAVLQLLILGYFFGEQINSKVVIGSFIILAGITIINLK